MLIFIYHPILAQHRGDKYVCFSTAYCVVAVESVGRQIPIAFLDRVKEDFTKKYGGGKAATAAANSLNREFGYAPYLCIRCLMNNICLIDSF